MRRSHWRRRARRTWSDLQASLEADRDRLVLWLPMCVSIGILAYFGLTREPGLAVGLSMTGVSLLLFAGARTRVSTRAVAAALLAMSVGFLVSQATTRRMPPPADLPRKASLTIGRIDEIDLLADGRRRVTLGAVTLATPAAGGEDPEPLAGRRLRIRLRDTDRTMLATGDLVRIRTLLHAPSPPDYPGGRDPQRDAFFSGLAGSGSALSPVVLLSHRSDGGVWGSVRRLRETIAARIMVVLPGPRGAVAATLLTGLSSAIPQTDRDAFAASGLAHLLAVAGLHLGIVMGLTLLILRIVLAAWEWGSLRLPMRQIAALGALAAGCGYMVLTGLHLPGLRSLAMAGIAVLGLLVGRRAVSMRTLAIAAILLLLASPATLLDVGYQMSFAAVMALLAGYEALRPMMVRLHAQGLLGWRRRVGLHVFQLFFTSLVAGAASLPYAAFHFGRVQFYFVLANLVAVPLTAFWVLPQGLLSLLLMPFGLEWVTLRQMGAGIDLILWLAREVAAFPAASLAVPASPVWGLLTVTFGLLWLCLWRQRWRLLAAVPLAIGLASPWLVHAPDLLVSGDGRLIALHRGRTMLVEQASWADPITLSDWRRAWAITAAPVPFADAGANPAGDVVCNPAACIITIRRQSVLLLRDAGETGDDAKPATEPDDCDGIALVVSSRPAHGTCHGIPRIDRFSVWRDGPEAVWLRAVGIRVESARTYRGHRPWVPAAPVPGGGRRPTLPMARLE
ncbi:ComEC/Rec2 family competence protein [Lichenicola cladoniae]|uniref:ComEC/Rec2 family competence protein n=1 Tax=Lichenicola cladoniae TaxID=1484109 RepID=A0A6M8HT38_9PROT|nr:ComEC/Rec2 family competence protein [Lichenicola cladoniae]NPD65393.1 ComEC/Rec2 family competence protein [Acetobacteraceae bacterium]QKE91528.1 ComEC/Rec2 family competence protein [Lichenicola cladoniae]